MIRVRITCLVLSATLSSACVPARAWDIPHVKGKIVRTSVPLGGATVTWATMNPEGQMSAVAVTNDRGEFEIASKGHREWTPLLPVHSLSKWRVDLHAGARAQVLWCGRMYVAGPRTTPGSVTLSCDIDATPPCALLEADHPRWVGDRGSRLPTECK